MKRVIATLCLAATVAAQPQAQQGRAKPVRGAAAKAALLSSGVVGGFIHESITLARDLTVFTAWSVASVGWDVVPLEQQKVVQDQWAQFVKAGETFRVQQGIMKPYELYELAWTHYATTGQPVLAKAFDVATKAVDKPFAMVKSFTIKFETAYPEQAGLLSSVSFWDFLLTVFFLVYFVLGYSKQAICYVICCGFCMKRNRSQGAPVLKKNPPAKQTNGVSKKR